MENRIAGQWTGREAEGVVGVEEIRTLSAQEQRERTTSLAMQWGCLGIVAISLLTLLGIALIFLLWLQELVLQYPVV